MEEIKRIISITTKGQDSMKSLRQEIKALKSQLLSLDKGTEEYSKTLTLLANKMRSLNDFNRMVKASAQDAGQMLSNLSKTAKGIIGGFSALNGAMALFGSESEELQKTMMKLQAGIAVVQGLSALEDLTKTIPYLTQNFKGLGDAVGGFFSKVFDNLNPFKKSVDELSTTINDLKMGDISIDVNAEASAKAADNAKEIANANNAALNGIKGQEAAYVPLLNKQSDLLKQLEAEKAKLEEVKDANKASLNASLEQTRNAKLDLTNAQQRLAAERAISDKLEEELEFRKYLRNAAIDQWKEMVKGNKELEKSLEWMNSGKANFASVDNTNEWKEALKIQKEAEDQLEEYLRSLGATRKEARSLREAIKGDWEEVNKGTMDAANAWVAGSKKVDAAQLKVAEAQKNLTQAVEKQKSIQLANKDAIVASEAAIKDVEVEIGKVNAQIKAVGGTVTKTGKLFKAFGTIVKGALGAIAVTALITAFVKLGQAISDAFKKVNEARKAARELNIELNKGEAGASKQIIALKSLARAYQSVGDSAEEKQKFLVEYSDKIKDTGLAIKDVNTAEEVFRTNTAKYIEALKSRAKAEAAQQLAVKKYQEYLEKRAEKEQSLAESQALATASQAQLDAMARSGNGGEGMAPVSKNLEAATKAANKTQAELDDMANSIEKDLENLFKVEDEYSTKANSILAGLTESIKDAGKTGADEAKKLAHSIEQTVKQISDETDAELNALAEAEEERRKLFKSEEEIEVEQVENKYKRLIDLAKKYGFDSKEYEDQLQTELSEIREKWAKDRIQKEIDDAARVYAQLEKELDKIRKMNLTSNLREPQRQVYQTRYTNGASTLLGLKGDPNSVDNEYGRDKGKMGSFINTYQTKEDLNKEYKAQVEYNDRLYQLTAERINQENDLLNKQLENEQLTADQREQIERTLRENEMALSDAALANERANEKAYDELQQKKQQALNATIEVASTAAGAMASIAQQEMNNENASEKHRKDALKAYKAAATAQAVMDTYKAANEAYAAMSGIPIVGPGLGIAAAIAAITAGIANVRQIQQTQLSSSASVSASSIPSPQPVQTAPISYSRELLGDKETDKVNSPIECFVLENSITTVQNRVAVREANSSF